MTVMMTLVTCIHLIDLFVCNSMSKSRFHFLLLMFMLSLPLLGELEPKAMLEDLTNCLQRHALDVWVEEHDKQPAQKAYTAIEAKCS